MLRVVKRLLDTGVSLQNIRVAVEHLRARGVEDLAGVTLFSDGTTVYECTSPEEIVDLLQGGQGVFGIAVGGTMREITGSLAEFPRERVEGDRVVPVEPRRARPAPAGPHRRLKVARSQQWVVHSPARLCADQRPISGAVLSGSVGVGSAQLTEAGQGAPVPARRVQAEGTALPGPARRSVEPPGDRNARNARSCTTRPGLR